MKFTEKDNLLLATLYEMPHWAVFRKKFMEERQMELAQAAAFLPEMGDVREVRGKIIELRHIDKEMQQIHNGQEKKPKNKS